MRTAVFVGTVLASFCTSTTHAAVIDLTTAGAEVTVTDALGNDFIVKQGSSGVATGTGVFNSFVRIERKDNEHGYNTSNRDVFFDEKTDPNFTRAINLAEIPLVTIDGVDYRVFNLDVNEPSGQDKPLLTINQIQIFVGDHDPTAFSSITPALPGDPGDYAPTTPPVISFDSLTEILRMNDSVADFDQIKLDYDLVGSGSGRDDMTLFVENSLFGTGNPFVVLYSHFGQPPGQYLSEAGFEEWGADTNGGGPNDPPDDDPPDDAPEITPEPASLAVWGLGLGLIGLGARRRMRMRKA